MDTTSETTGLGIGGGKPSVEESLSERIDALCEEVRELYCATDVPWVVGYSGGKDSTAILQLVWIALEGLEAEKRTKPVYVISTDTLVENPVVAAWVSRSLKSLGDAAAAKNLPIRPNRLTPEVSDTFWVNLIGRGYPAPRPKFRWCTERLKIKPANKFILDVVRKSGEAILVLGTRKAESTARARSMAKHAEGRTRARLSPNASLPNSLIYTPIEDWSNDDVWLFLMQIPNPWNHPNKDLLTMYQGASPDGECPLVVDSTTPSCGDSRFGCWVCTMVEKDKSMSAMIQNDEEKEWMQPLLNLRNELDVVDDKPLRDFRRMGGNVTLFHDAPVHGPYTPEARADWLRKLLQVQMQVRKMGPPHVGELELITLDELREIRRIWVVEKHEIEDWLPAIYQQATGESFPGEEIRRGPFGAQELAILERECGEGFLQYEMLRNLLDTEHKYRTSLRRSRIFEDLEQVIRRCFYDSVEDATERARECERASNPGKPSVSPGAEKALEEKEPALPGLAAAASSSRAGL